MKLKWLVFSLFLTTAPLLSSEQIFIEEEFNSDVNQAIVEGIQKYNLPYFKQQDLNFFVIYARNDAGEIIGGLCGDILGACACVDYAWVEEHLRGKGIGTRLFATLEDYVKKHKCTVIQLFTYDFQAESFYAKLGFKKMGTIPKWIEDHDVIFLRKTL